MQWHHQILGGGGVLVLSLVVGAYAYGARRRMASLGGVMVVVIAWCTFFGAAGALILASGVRLYTRLQHEWWAGVHVTGTGAGAGAAAPRGPPLVAPPGSYWRGCGEDSSLWGGGGEHGPTSSAAAIGWTLACVTLVLAGGAAAYRRASEERKKAAPALSSHVKAVI